MSIKELKTMIKKEWKTAGWMEINGFTFFMYMYDHSITATSLVIFNKNNNKYVTDISWKKINSLIIDDEVIL